MTTGNSVVKSYSSFSVSDGLLKKVVEAVKQGESLARRSGQIRSFEVFYHGLRSDLVLGRVMVIPAAVADSIEDFPSALLYGAMVSMATPETISDAYSFKLGEGEFDKYSKKDMAAIKDLLFRDTDGKYRSIIMFVPTWGAPRDYVTFKYVKDEEQLTMLIRHVVFAAYFDPALSSAFDRMTSETTSSNLDVTDITPKLNFPFLAEGLLKQYPVLQPGDKRASKPKRKIVLAKDTLREVNQELPESGEILEPGEQAVMNQLGEELEAKIGSDKNASQYMDHRDHAHLNGKGRTCEPKHMTHDGKCTNCGYDPAKKQAAAKVALGFKDGEKNPLKPGERVKYRDQAHQVAPVEGTVAEGQINWDNGEITRLDDAVNMTRVERSESKTAAIAEEKTEEQSKKGSLDGDTIENCERPERERCDHVDPAQCCGGGYDSACTCPDCHKETGYAKNFEQRFNRVSNKTAAPSPETVARVRHLYTSGHGREHIKNHFQIDDTTLDAILRGDHGKGSFRKEAPKKAECLASEYCPQCGKDAQGCKCPNKEELLKKAVAKQTCPCCGGPVNPLKTLLKQYVDQHGGDIPDVLFVSVDNDYVSTERPDHYKYLYVTRKDAERILGNPAQAQVQQKAASVLLALGGAKLLRVGSTLFAHAASGYKEKLRVNGIRIKWTRPNQFPHAFKSAAEKTIRLPRVANLLKQAEVPQTIEDIWDGKMDDMGPAPVVELTSEGTNDGTAETKSEESAKSEGEKKEWEKPWEKKDGDEKSKTASSRMEKLEQRRGIGKCANCSYVVTDKTGSEVAPDVFLHAACQKALRRATADKLVVRQVLAAFYPEVLKQRRTANYELIQQAIKILVQKGQIPDNMEFPDMTPGEQQAVLQVARGLQRETDKVAAYDMFIPGQVAQEFAPEVLHDIVDFPEADYNPLITDVGPPPVGPYVTTDPAGALGIGADGKPQVLDGAPLRKVDEIRGPMFDQEFYQQYQGIEPSGLRAASVASRVKKKADVSEYRDQFADFLKKVVGEVAATFIAAFKVTNRPMMNEVPGTGEVQLQNVEQSSLGAPYNIQNVASRVRHLVDKLNDSDIQDAINAAWSKADVYNDSEQGGYVYEVFVRPESLDQDTLILRYSFVIGTKGL